MENRTDTEELQSNQETDKLECMLCKDQCTVKDSLDTISAEKWENIKDKSLQWKGIDKFQHVNTTMEWDKGPKGYYMHASCYTTMSSTRAQSQATKRKHKSEKPEERAGMSGQQSSFFGPPPKKLRSSIGVLHDKALCVWCMRGPQKSGNRDKKHFCCFRHKMHGKGSRHTLSTLQMRIQESG